MCRFNSYIHVIRANVSCSKSVFLTFLVLTNCHLMSHHTHIVVAWLWSGLSLDGCDYWVDGIMILLQYAFTLELCLCALSGPFNCVYVYVSGVCAKEVWQSPVQQEEVIHQVGKVLLFIPGSSCAKILADWNLFLWGYCGFICSLCKASAVMKLDVSLGSSKQLPELQSLPFVDS